MVRVFVLSAIGLAWPDCELDDATLDDATLDDATLDDVTVIDDAKIGEAEPPSKSAPPVSAAPSLGRMEMRGMIVEVESANASRPAFTVVRRSDGKVLHRRISSLEFQRALPDLFDHWDRAYAKQPGRTSPQSAGSHLDGVLDGSI